MHRTWMRVFVAAVCSGVWTPGFVRAQAPAAGVTAAKLNAPAFDVVSIRPDQRPRSGPTQYGPTVDGYKMDNFPLGMIVMAAYPPNEGGGAFFLPDNIVGLPDWMRSERYDVDARVAESDLARWKDPAEQPALTQAMLQRMLAERLKMTVHREMKEKPVFEMHLTKDASKLKLSANQDLASVQAKHPKAGQLPGGMILVESEGNSAMLYNATMASLGALISQMAGRPVVDKTGLTGKYDITLTLDFSPGPNGEAPDRASVMILALQQIGLKLEPAKSQVEMLVIDHVEKPSEN